MIAVAAPLDDVLNQLLTLIEAQLNGIYASVLLLDEVAAHLDRERRQGLFGALAALGCQAWMTGTDPSLFAPLGANARFLTVAAGHLRNAN